MLHLEQNHRKVSTQFLESYETFPFYISKACIVTELIWSIILTITKVICYQNLNF